MIAPTPLGFTGVPTVRIPDGNLVRVIGEALREWVRVDVMRRRFEEVRKHWQKRSRRLEFLCRAPEVSALVSAIARLERSGASDDSVIVYAEPALEPDLFEAIEVVMHKHLPAGRVLPFRTFLAEGLAP